MLAPGIVAPGYEDLVSGPNVKTVDEFPTEFPSPKKAHYTIAFAEAASRYSCRDVRTFSSTGSLQTATPL
jgi:hypothetical protein